MNLPPGGAITVPAQPLPPGYVRPAATPAPTMGETDNNRFTENAERILRGTGERIAWQGKPSPVFLVPRMAVWSVVLLFAIFWAASIGAGWGWVLFWTCFAAIHLGIRYLEWHNTLYRVTSQRLEVTQGVFVQKTDTVNLVEIRQVRIERRFPWNFLGLGDLIVDALEISAGSANLRLRGIRDVPTVRDLIHGSSNITGQLWDERRFGTAQA
jgi:hypothetical protein